MERKAINLEEKFGLLVERWQPQVVAELNDYQFKVVKLLGDVVWHDHAETRPSWSSKAGCGTGVTPWRRN